MNSLTLQVISTNSEVRISNTAPYVLAVETPIHIFDKAKTTGTTASSIQFLREHCGDKLSLDNIEI